MKTFYVLILSTFLACISVSKLHAQAPGGVSAPDFWVKSDDAGTIATAWKDHSANANNIPAVGIWTLSPADRAHNFHPYTTNYTGTKYFYNNASVLNPTNGLLSDVSHSIFSAVRPITAGQGRIVGIDDTPGYASEPAFSIENGILRFYKFSGGASFEYFTEEPFKIGAINVVSGIGNNPVTSGGTSTSSGGERVLGMNGIYKTYPYTGTNRFHFNGQHLRIGEGDWSASGAFPGDIMEVIWYKRALSANEQSRVNSYLAIKNGTTLAENYLAANSNIVWDRTINNGYNNNIFGIARDDASALHQKQAASTPENQKLVLGHGSSLFNTNADNTNSLVDGQFLVVGDNGLKQSLTTPLVFTGDANGPTNFRFESIWKVQNTGSVGTVTVAWPKGLNNLYLVQSPDAAFDDTDTFTPMASEVTVNGVVYNTANVTLTNGQFFTFAGFAYAPAGVTNGITYWYRGDKSAANTGDGTDVTTWVDQWSGNTVSSVAGNSLPKYKQGAVDYFNFNAGVNFTDINQTIGTRSVQTIFNANNDLFMVTKEGMTSPGGSNPHLFSIGMDNVNTTINNWDYLGVWPNGNVERRVYNGSTTFPNVTPDFSTTIPSIMYYNFLDRPFSRGLNGAANGTTYNSTGAMGIPLGGHIFGSTKWTGSGSDNDGFIGHIAETVIYGAGNLTTTERRRVDSYLAIKYGITLGRVDTDHYLDADAAMVWNGASNTAYNNNIFGIAREDIGLFEQKVSKSVNAGTILTVATTNDFVNPNDNAARARFTNDKTYFLLGDNNVTSPNLTSVIVAGNTWKRIQRAWLSQRKNTPNALYFEADLSTFGSSFAASNTVYMLVADDAAFTTNVKSVAGTYTAGKWVFSNNFNTENAQRYITFATVLPSYCVTGDCNPNTFLNTSDPNTIEYDNIVSTFHSTMMRDASSGALMVWGEDMANNGVSDILSPIEVNNTNYPALTGDILKFTAGSLNITRNQKVVLTTDGLFAWGGQGYLISTDITSSTTFQKVSIGTYGVNGGTPKADGLPDGVAPEDVKMLFGSYRTLALTTCTGEAWVLAQSNSFYGDNTPDNATNDQLWHRVHIDATTTLNNVVAIRGNGDHALMALTAAGEVYTWGQNTFLGNGTAQAVRPFATQMTLPAGVTPKMIGATRGITYYVLDNNGNLYSLGINTYRQLGNFTTTNSNTWVQVQKSATADDYLTNVVWISPNEHDGLLTVNGGSINVLTADGRLWAWGENHNTMLGGTGNPINPTEMPGSIPATNPYDIGKLNWTDKVIAVETGGHTSMIVKDNRQKYGYIGHRVNGSMGDGTSTDATESEYNFAATPEIYLCGALVVTEICTNPGVFDAPGLPSTTGISNLAGFTGGTTGWPANVPNGHIVIESKNKGFVITRVSSSAAILNPVEGMLIYDIAAACVKLYNGTVWNCLAKDCIPATN